MKVENFDHLVLLIGTNSLPNFVVADYFLQQNPKLHTVWLLHSEANSYQAGTLEMAGSLEALLRQRHLEESGRKVNFPKVPLSDVSDALKIKQDIGRYMETGIKRGESIHLNYTGGTKSMSTHAHRIIGELPNEEKTFSYLDGRNFRLVSDRKGILAEDLRRHVTATVQELAALHGFERKKGKESPFAFSDALKIFEELIRKGETAAFYAEGGYDRGMFLKQDGSLATNCKEISEESRGKLEAFIPGEPLISINAAMPEEYRFFDSEGCFSKGISKRKFKAAVKFLDGLWLEEYVAKVMKPLSEDHITIEQNWNLLKPDWSQDMDFEIDILLMNGYQLTGISCTTDTRRAICKSKGFEVIHRTRQIGGGEAKSVLITRTAPRVKDQLQEELLHETGGLLGNILVLGEMDLKEEILTQEIRRFILN